MINLTHSYNLICALDLIIEQYFYDFISVKLILTVGYGTVCKSSEEPEPSFGSICRDQNAENFKMQGLSKAVPIPTQKAMHTNGTSDTCS